MEPKDSDAQTNINVNGNIDKGTFVVGDGNQVNIDNSVHYHEMGILYEQISKAEKYSQDDVARCKIYLDTAQTAIQGLENEYDEILNEAETCRLDQLDKILSLQKRILDYLQLDRFRDVLWKVHAGIRGCRTALQGNVERKWLSGTKEKRQEAVTDLVSTLEALEGYIAHLQDRDLQYRRAFTGVGIKWLIGIKQYLSTAENLHSGVTTPNLEQIADTRKDLIQYIADARQDRSKDRLKDSTTRITDTIEILIRSFR